MKIDEPGFKSLEERWGEFKTACKNRWYRVCDWFRANKDVLVVVTPIIIGSGVELVKVVLKSKTTSDEKALKERYIYDRSNGHYYETRRKIKSREWIEIDTRHRMGESVGDILSDMRLLK